MYRKFREHLSRPWLNPSSPFCLARLRQSRPPGVWEHRTCFFFRRGCLLDPVLGLAFFSPSSLPKIAYEQVKRPPLPATLLEP